MHSFPADPARSNYTTRIHPLLTGFVDEVCGTVARLCAYVMTLVLMAIGAIALWQQLPDATAMAPSVRDGWAVATRSAPAFAVSHGAPRPYLRSMSFTLLPAGIIGSTCSV